MRDASKPERWILPSNGSSSNDSGELLSAWGGLPLQVEPADRSPDAATIRDRVRRPKTIFVSIAFPILSNAGKAERTGHSATRTSPCWSRPFAEHIYSACPSCSGLAGKPGASYAQGTAGEAASPVSPRGKTYGRRRTSWSSSRAFNGTSWPTPQEGSSKGSRWCCRSLSQLAKGGQVFNRHRGRWDYSRLGRRPREAGGSLDQLKLQVGNFLEDQIDPSFASLWRIKSEDR